MNSMKENFTRINFMVRESINGKTFNAFIMVNEIKGKCQVKVYLYGRMAHAILEIIN